MDRQDHGSLALWAADCAAHVLPRFEEERPGDERPRRAIEAGRAWARGGMEMSEARAATFAAREADRAEAQATARAAGHAAATAHVATHAPHAAAYTVKAVTYAAAPTYSAATEERDW